ncbi:MAG: hypothetical protein KA914_16035 [Ottowia sp.]|jgi:hypothetical protein|nr:hypothetical protein [Ottowia sp.]
MWQDEGTWIALGVSALFLVMAFAMHRVFMKILRSRPPDEREELSKDE